MLSNYKLSKLCLLFSFKIVLNQEIKGNMKTIILTLALAHISLMMNALNENKVTKSVDDTINKSSVTILNADLEILVSSFQQELWPVYFNYRRRQLKDAQKNNISPVEFLNLCRSIRDSAVQLQVARYDSYTKDKERLGVVALVGGFSAMGLFGSAAAYSGQGNDIITGSLVFLGVIGFLAIPAAAIYSSVPHQKRKSVLFRDLPIAYNQYVESHP
jgi:hypothetical protein